MQLQLHKEVENKAHQSAKKMHDLELQQAEARAEAAARDGGKKGRKAAKDAKKDSQKAFRPPQVGSAANHVELRFTNALLQISRGCYYLLVALEKGGFTQNTTRSSCRCAGGSSADSSPFTR